MGGEDTRNQISCPFCCCCCGSVIGDTFLSFSTKVPLTVTHQSDLLSDTSEEVLFHSSAAPLRAACSEVLSGCGLSFHVAVWDTELPLSSQGHIGLGSVVSELNCQCLFHLSWGLGGEAALEELALRQWQLVLSSSAPGTRF